MNALNKQYLDWDEGKNEGGAVLPELTADQIIYHQ